MTELQLFKKNHKFLGYLWGEQMFGKFFPRLDENNYAVSTFAFNTTYIPKNGWYITLIGSTGTGVAIWDRVKPNLPVSSFISSFDLFSIFL